MPAQAHGLSRERGGVWEGGCHALPHTLLDSGHVAMVRAGDITCQDYASQDYTSQDAMGLQQQPLSAARVRVKICRYIIFICIYICIYTYLYVYVYMYVCIYI